MIIFLIFVIIMLLIQLIKYMCLYRMAFKKVGEQGEIIGELEGKLIIAKIKEQS